MQPYISVIVTAYNRKEFLKDSLESLLKQTISVNEFEVILITNFEFDIGDYNNLQIRQQITEGSMREFMIRGIEMSNGEIICFLDDDDIFMEDKLKKVKEIFQSNPDVDYYRHNFQEVDYSLKPLRRNSVKHVRETKYIASSDFKNNLMYLTFNEVFFNSSTIVLRKKMIIVDDDMFFTRNSAPDFMLWALAVVNANAIYIDKAELSFYRIHKTSTIHAEKGEEKYKCEQDETLPFLSKIGAKSKERKILLNLITLKVEVMSSLFCKVNFTPRHYFMNILMILLSDNRFKATLVLLRKMKLMNKPVIIKMLTNEQSAIGLIEKFVALFRPTQ